MASNTEIIHTIQGLRAMLETLEAQLSGGKAAPVSKAPAAEKPKRTASDALKAWNAYVDLVKADMVATGWTHPETGKPVTRKDAMQEAKARRETDPNAYRPKPKEATKSEEPSSDTEVKAKPKRVLTDEQKAKMAAGRKAAAERRKAEKEAAAAEVSAPKKVSFAPPPLPPSDDEAEDDNLSPITVKGRKYLMNTEMGYCWKRNLDGTKGDWAGIYDTETKTIDDTIGEDEL